MFRHGLAQKLISEALRRNEGLRYDFTLVNSVKDRVRLARIARQDRLCEALPRRGLHRILIIDIIDYMMSMMYAEL